MKRAPVLPMPFPSAWDPRATASGSIDPLGALRPYTVIASTLLPGVTTITSRARYLSWVCAGLRLLDELPDAPSGGRDGRARRRRILAWERLVALATGIHAMAKDAAASDRDTFRLLGKHLLAQRDPLAAVLTVASSFENLHGELLYRFNQVLASDCLRPVPLENPQLRHGNGSLARLGDALKGALERHGTALERSVAEAVHDFSLAVEPAVRAQNDAQTVRELIRHHDRVQTGKLDASRQPKRPWVELRGNHAVIAPRHALDERPGRPGSAESTHPYRIEQFMHMLRDAGVWESAS